MIVAAIRDAVDGAPVRLRFIKALCPVLAAMMLLWGVLGGVTALRGMSLASGPERSSAIAEGISHVVNTWGLSALVFALASIIVALGVYRAGRRELA